MTSKYTVLAAAQKKLGSAGAAAWLHTANPDLSIKDHECPRRPGDNTPAALILTRCDLCVQQVMDELEEL